MRVLLTSHGSTGDIFPVIALGVALRKAGHTVRFAAPSLFRESIERAGLTFVYVPPDWEQDKFAACMKELDASSNPLFQLEKIYRNSLPYLVETLAILTKEAKEADLLVGSYLFPAYNSIAKKCNIPFAVFTFAHNVVPTDRSTPDQWPDFSFLPGKIQKYWSRLVWNCSDWIVDSTLNRITRSFIKKGMFAKHRGFFTRPAPLSLVGVSPALMQPKAPPAKHFVFTGYLRWQSPADEKMGEMIAAFCAGEKVPVLNFGSVAFEKVDALMRRFQAHWNPQKKIIIQSGWAGLSLPTPNPHILLIGKLSHDQLFQFASCVIHHGGAGTTASVLHAGCPHIVVPHIADQDFFAREIKRLGAGYAVSKKVWPEKIPHLVELAENNHAMQDRAQELARILATEDGPSRAVQTLEQYVADYRKN